MGIIHTQTIDNEAISKDMAISRASILSNFKKDKVELMSFKEVAMSEWASLLNIFGRYINSTNQLNILIDKFSKIEENFPDIGKVKILAYLARIRMRDTLEEDLPYHGAILSLNKDLEDRSNEFGRISAQLSNFVQKFKFMNLDSDSFIQNNLTSVLGLKRNLDLFTLNQIDEESTLTNQYINKLHKTYLALKEYTKVFEADVDDQFNNKRRQLYSKYKSKSASQIDKLHSLTKETGNLTLDNIAKSIYGYLFYTETGHQNPKQAEYFYQKLGYQSKADLRLQIKNLLQNGMITEKQKEELFEVFKLNKTKANFIAESKKIKTIVLDEQVVKILSSYSNEATKFARHLTCADIDRTKSALKDALVSTKLAQEVLTENPELFLLAVQNKDKFSEYIILLTNLRPAIAILLEYGQVSPKQLSSLENLNQLIQEKTNKETKNHVKSDITDHERKIISNNGLNPDQLLVLIKYGFWYGGQHHTTKHIVLESIAYNISRNSSKTESTIATKDLHKMLNRLATHGFLIDGAHGKAYKINAHFKSDGTEIQNVLKTLLRRHIFAVAE